LKRTAKTIAEFNLVDEDWIPSVDFHGQRKEYGILDTLLTAHKLREICDDSPLVTVAIHRLLLAILYRAHNGPKDLRSWSRLYSSGAVSRKNVVPYLSAWHDKFWLITDSYPFFQMGQLETKRAVSITRLASECASGNNATLFDHSVDEHEAHWEPRRVAKQLIACQSFALGFGKSGNAKIDGKDEILPYSADGIALRGMNVWLEGSTLFDTLMINLAPTDDDSLPPWEMENPHKYRDRLKGKVRRLVTSLGRVDRLTWQSRLIRILPNRGNISRMYFTQGRSADKSPGDPMKVYRASRKEGIFPLPLSSAKAVWRDAHSILAIRPPATNERRPECFSVVARTRGEVHPKEHLVVNVMGLASAPNKAGKFLLWRHERMPVPAALLGDADLIDRLGKLLQDAEQVAFELVGRTRRIAKLYLAPKAESADGRQPDSDELASIAGALDPRPTYWARMEKHFFVLLENLANDWDSKRKNWNPDDQPSATSTWRSHVKDEAQRALEESIRCLGNTVRAIQAVARVRTDFNDGDLNPPDQKMDKAKRKGRGGKMK
jgi:CRISPR system Cascade subunit CasA